jgi:PEP-CTERM motif
MKRTLSVTHGVIGFNSTVWNQGMVCLKKLVVLAGAILLSMQVTHAQVPIYREVFGNNTAGNLNLTTVGWSGNWGPTATDSTGGGMLANNFGVSAALGSPQNLENINAGGPSLSQANGLLFTSGGTAATMNWIAYTTGYTVDPIATPIQDISFYAGSSANGTFGIPGFRIAVEIGGNWYASTSVLANPIAVTSAGNFHLGAGSGGAQQVTFNWTTAASAWDSLTFVPGTSLVLGSTLLSDLPASNITAFGVYSDAEAGTGATRRLDTYQIDTVPEPSSVVLGLFGVGVLMGLRRSRKA